MKRSSVIGEPKLLFERKDDRRRISVALTVGRPYWVKKDIEAACQIEAKGLFDNLHDIHGVDTLQAIELAARFMDVLLQGFSDRYDVFWSDGHLYDIAAGRHESGTLTRSRRMATKRPKRRTRVKAR